MDSIFFIALFNLDLNMSCTQIGGNQFLNFKNNYTDSENIIFFIVKDKKFKTWKLKYCLILTSNDDND